MPPHLQYNKFVLHGYRPHGPEHGVIAALLSLFYWHNESLNIFTHLFGAVLCCYWLMFPSDADINLPHYWVVRNADASAAVCFLGSAAYHTLMSATTSDQYRTLLSADLVGIVIAGCGATFSLGWLSLPCMPFSFVLTVSVLPSVLALIWMVGFARTPGQRAMGAGVQLLTRFTVIVGGALTGTGHWPASWLVANLGSELCLVFGALLSSLRIPERWVPGSPVFTYLQSHTMMHILSAWTLLFQHCLWTWRCEHLASNPAVLACADANAAGLFGSM